MHPHAILLALKAPEPDNGFILCIVCLDSTELGNVSRPFCVTPNVSHSFSVRYGEINAIALC